MTIGVRQTAAGWVLAAVVLALLAWALPTQAGGQDGPGFTVPGDIDPWIIINEVLADPASDWNKDGVVDAKGDEWIELRNVSTMPLDLGTYFLRDGSGDTPDLQLSGTIDPDEHAIWFGSDSVAWQAANGLSTTGFALNNTGDVVQLVRSIPGTSPVQYELVFAVAISDHEADDDRSSGFDWLRTSWQLFDAMFPYTGALVPVGTGCAPSPTAPNQCGGNVPTESASFGTLKATYR
jgi:hypothetical protein